MTKENKFPEFMKTPQFAFSAHTVILVGMVASATYAGTSSLFAAYLGGVIVKWFDEYYAELKTKQTSSRSGSPQSIMDQSHANSQEWNAQAGEQRPCEHTSSNSSLPMHSKDHKVHTGEVIYEKYYKGPVDRILIPFFFASIGFAIPITEMFRGNIVWRGVVYAILMVFGKMVTGLWLMRFSTSPVGCLIHISKKVFSYISLACTGNMAKSKKKQGTLHSENKTTRRKSTAIANPGQVNASSSSAEHVQSLTRASIAEKAKFSPLRNESTLRSGGRVSLPPKPKSLYPPAIIGLAMIARGEIGYLIAALAQSRGIFSSSTDGESSDAYLVIIWAISLCTLIGPIAVGTLTRRVKRLQQIRVNTGGEDPLGVWGI
ncbi:hypothetical protein TMatcc_002372 [Talaromyces marneffei ATCC 18224]|uniref:Na+/H+ antiporter, putative n=2 Tax=Talaromyces marneffei TaxID=37727 RepID=B6QJM6_TALMQ|nr:Na+/H+ antiporter, putative [Talaromyces marneffei ATCC 18224]